MSSWIAAIHDRKRVVAMLEERDGFRCKYCRCKLLEGKRHKTDPRRVTIDHYIPRALGGSEHLDNLVLACLGCNSAKANLLPEEYEKVRKR